MIHINRSLAFVTIDINGGAIPLRGTWIHCQNILVTDSAKIAQGRNCIPQSVNKSLIYRDARACQLCSTLTYEEGGPENISPSYYTSEGHAAERYGR